MDLLGGVIMAVCETLVSLALSLKSCVLGWLSNVHEFGMVSSNYGSLAAALVVAFVLFFIRELFIRASDYSGVFYVMSTVEDSTYKPYKGMKLFHTLVLCSDGYVVSGTSEKTGDIDAVRAYEYPGATKIRGEVSGRIERNYFWNTVMNLHIVEQGAERVSSSFMSIKVRRIKCKGSTDSGKFYSTAAQSKGVLMCGRESFKEHPIGHSPFLSTSVSGS
ncbi:hypothetical protein [Pseudomonas putida]|uniref:hypothetical protein n=1 Tax=Pseudomonas putida TaxID=303 RepID=UPI0013747B7C|nr:hypothetical protein [Pseudomonas putida]